MLLKASTRLTWRAERREQVGAGGGAEEAGTCWAAGGMAAGAGGSSWFHKVELA